MAKISRGIIAGVKTDLYRKLPSVDEVLRDPAVSALASSEGLAPITDAARTVLNTLRGEIGAGNLDATTIELALAGIPSAVERQVREAASYHLCPVINATGVILHTNLGRAPLSEAAINHIQEIASGYSNLEYDLESNERGTRDVHVDRLFRKLLAEAAPGPSTPLRAGAAPSLHGLSRFLLLWLITTLRPCCWL